ncbi:MAG: hypothetical protein V1799_22075 [bacterium]
MKSTFRSRIPWREKMNRPQEPQIIEITPAMQQRFGTGTMLIPTPRLIDDLIKKTPKGKLLTIGEIRRRLAKDFKVNTVCPLTTGIFIRIAAEAANEELMEGKKRVTPFWRLIRNDESLLEKNPGGIAGQAKMLKNESHEIISTKGKKLRVSEFEKKLTTL